MLYKLKRQLDLVLPTPATEKEVSIMLRCYNWNVSEVEESFCLYPHEVWTVLPPAWALALARFPLDVRKKALKDFLPQFPRDVLEECSQELSPEHLEYFSLIALRAFVNASSNSKDMEFAQTMQLGKTELLPFFQEWAKQLKEMEKAPAGSLEWAVARERFKLLLNQTLPSLEETNPAFCGIAEDAANVGVTCCDGAKVKRNSLHIAASSNDLDLVNNLLASNVRFDARDSDYNTALHLGADHPGIVAVLLDSSERAEKLEQFVELVNDKGETALHVCDNVESARLLLHAAPNLVFVKDGHGKTALHSSVNGPNMVDFFFSAMEDAQQLEKFVQQVDDWGRTALHVCENAESARLLLRASPDLIFVKENDEGTALHCTTATPDVVKVLLEAFTDSEQREQFVFQTDDLGQTALQVCGCLESARLLLAVSPGLASIKCEKGNTPLHIHAMRSSEDFCRFLIMECGADVNAANARGQTPLHLACYARQVETMALLLAHSAQMLTRDFDQHTILHYIMIKPRRTENFSLARYAQKDCHNQAPSALKLLLTHSKINFVDELVAARDLFGRTALHYCETSSRDHDEMADMLIMAEVHADVQDVRGDTLMHVAIGCCGDLKLAMHLIKQWALSIHVKNHAGETALDLVSGAPRKVVLERVSMLACAVTLRLAARSKATKSPWHRLPRELFGELCSFLV